jgi:hypothetical protein
LDFCSHAGEAQEDAIQIAAHGDVEVRQRAEDAAAFELVEENTGPAEEKQDEHNVTQSAIPYVSYAATFTCK